MALTYSSTFAGIGGFDIGFDQAGMQCVSQVEINKHASKVLAHHWPDVPRGEDIKDVHGSDLGGPDVLVGGFPCKNITRRRLGGRAGLDSADSGLFWEFQRLVEEHVRLTDESKARWVVIENVEGLLTSPGRGRDGVDRTGWDLAAVTRALEDIGYGWAFRTVDSGFLDSSQRRKRVIVVGHRSGDPRVARAVLADTGAGDEVGTTSGVRRRATGPKALAGSVNDDGDLVFRKVSNPRAALDKGGYETWEALDAHGLGNTLTGFDWGNALRQKHIVVQGGRARTLTMTEWERLSGVPDDWTAGVPESARAEALGNIAHPHLTGWLGRRLTAVDAQVKLHPLMAA